MILCEPELSDNIRQMSVERFASEHLFPRSSDTVIHFPLTKIEYCVVAPHF